MGAPLATQAAGRAGAHGRAALMGAALSLAAGVGWAQQARALPGVVISASSLGLTEAAINQSVDVFTREQIEARPAASVGEFLLRQAGIMVDRPGRSGGYGSLYLRGADPSHVVVLIDGVRQNDPLSSRGSAVDLNSLSLDDIERIEVVRGNTSVAHGEAMAGVVALYTAAGGAEHRRVRSEAGGDGLRALAASFKSPSWRLSASHRQDGVRETGSMRVDALNLGFREQMQESAVQVDLRLAQGLQRSFPDDSGGARLASARGLESNDFQSRQLSGQVRRELGALGALEMGLHLFARSGLQDTPGVAPGVRDPSGLPPLRSHADYDRVAGRLQWLTHAGGWDLLAGLESQREHGELDSVIFIGDGVPAAFSITRRTTSVFAEARRTLGRLSYHLGLRSEATPGQGSVRHPSLGVQYELPDALGAHRWRSLICRQAAELLRPRTSDRGQPAAHARVHAPGGGLLREGLGRRLPRAPDSLQGEVPEPGGLRHGTAADAGQSRRHRCIGSRVHLAQVPGPANEASGAGNGHGGHAAGGR